MGLHDELFIQFNPVVEDDEHEDKTRKSINE